MKKRELIPELTLSQNLRFIMSNEGLTFKDLAKNARISQMTAYRLIEKNPIFVTDQLVRLGKSLGLTERKIREKSAQDRLAAKFTYSKKERVYQLVAELINLFETKAGK